MKICFLFSAESEKMLKKIMKTSVLLATGFLVVAAVSCKSKKTDTDSMAVEKTSVSENGTHVWYYFTKSGFMPTDLPQNAPSAIEKPWTESIRICGSANASDTNNKSQPPSYAIVNRLGIITFSEKAPVLHGDVNIFSENTVSSMFLQDNIPVFSVYKSSFFNDKTPVQKTAVMAQARPFLINYDINSGVFFPLIFYEDIHLAINEQVTDFSWDGKSFNCSVKTTENAKNTFSYFTIMPSVSLLSISQKNISSVLSIGESNAETFRASKKFADFSEAPERLKKLLAKLPKNQQMLMECSFSGNSSAVTYRQSGNDENSCLMAKAVIADLYALVVFSDGTCYFSGSCYSRPVLAGGKVLGFRLPKLPERFIYSYPALSGTKLYVAWEETSFYKTGRSGFIEIDLDSVLYSKFRN